MNTKQRYIIVPGVHKGGTTSLFRYLNDHPAVFAPLKKELHYFTPLVYGKPISDLSTYLSNFERAGDDQLRLDVSPSYLYGGKKVIHALNQLGDIRVLLILRDPIQRFISFYKQGITLGFIPANESLETFFQKSLEAFKRFEKTGEQIDTFYNRSLREGCYSLYITDWLEAYPDQLHLFYFESFTENPGKQMQIVCNFLNIENIYKNYAFTVENKSFKPKSQRLSKLSTKIFRTGERFFRRNERIKNALKRIYLLVNKSDHEKVSDEIIEKLQQFYHPYTRSFYKLLEERGIKLPQWKNFTQGEIHSNLNL